MSQLATPSLIDSDHFRRVLGQYPTGVCVITGIGPDGKPVGMTVGTFTSVSLDPPLVAFLPGKNSRAYAAIARSGRFAVNILAGDQVALCRRFASRESDKFRSVSWRPSPQGSPLLDDAVAWIDCRLDAAFEVGDHVMVIGAVEGLDIERETAPLMFFQGGFGRFSALSVVSGALDDTAAHLRLAELAGPRLQRLSTALGVHAAASARAGDHVIQLAWAGAEDSDLPTNLVGLRLPFAAPFGLTFAAWETEAVRDRWLGRHIGDAVYRDALLESLERARSQGWSAIPDHVKLREIESSIARIASAGQLPDAIRELDARIVDFACEYAELSDERPRGVSVPVFDRAGQVMLALTVQRLPEMDQETLDRCRTALVDVGREMTAALDGTPPAG
ncbi:flavin reductase [Amycolatopsis sp. WAC 04197]|uniref:flavin reductase n=1 Tax=Amycolatopsis sp. WAC 04197 TaxID=2203199 RepID=UPI000F7674A2|nr:flavin reductase [Amycolatopsis sp. WAC 04197]RSN45192.1 flavin reductase [Amycolatopsis sp. WAC 04197]